MSVRINPFHTVPCGSWLASDSGRTFDKLSPVSPSSRASPLPQGRCGFSRSSQPLLLFFQLVVFAILVPLVNHVVGDFQVALAVPGLFTHDSLDRVLLQPLS